MYERILVPVDGSDHAREAAEHAIDLAEQCGATLHVMSVVWTGTPYAGWEAPGLPQTDLISSLEEQAQRVIDEVVDLAERSGIESVEVLEASEQVAARILAYADQADVDLIVMGTHGRSGIARFLLGSVAEHVLRQANVPVMTVRSEDEEKEG